MTNDHAIAHTNMGGRIQTVSQTPVATPRQFFAHPRSSNFFSEAR